MDWEERDRKLKEYDEAKKILDHIRKTLKTNDPVGAVQKLVDEHTKLRERLDYYENWFDIHQQINNL